MSLKMLNAALAYQKAVRSMHVPFFVLSKAKAIGAHWKTLDITVPNVKAMTIAMKIRQVLWNQSVIKILR